MECFGTAHQFWWAIGAKNCGASINQTPRSSPCSLWPTGSSTNHALVSFRQHPQLPLMSEKVLATLTFDAASGRGPLQFLLSNDGKNVITVGRAPKSDVIVTLSGISWNHLELHLGPAGPAGLHLLVKDLSSNGALVDKCCT
eukprot:Skav211706  [mRNA]  locus=scaffold4901:31512:33029:+ [translate_table: standard]